MIAPVPKSMILAKHRPASYYDELRAIAVAETDTHLTLDSNAESYLALMKKYEPHRRAEKEHAKEEHAARAKGSWGRRKWESLHRWALGDAAAITPAWLSAFGRSLPCGDCVRHWQQVLTNHPADFTKSMFPQTVVWHNAVSEIIGKPQIGFDDAALRWSEP